MKKNKGFTLVELLAVIIILGVIVIIATPIIKNVIEDSKKKTGISESKMILNEIVKYCETEEIYDDDPNYQRICNESMNNESVKNILESSDNKIEKIKYDGENIVDLVISSNNHKFTMCQNQEFVVDGEKCPIIKTGTIEKIVTNNFPQLEIDSSNNLKGCKVPNDYTYSFNGGCYFKGIVHDNYIWYSGFLWRIMGINADSTIALIMDENATAIEMGDKAMYAKKWLNEYFYPNLKHKEIITNQQWCDNKTTNSNEQRSSCINSTDNTNIRLITLDEYNLAGGAKSYLNNHQNFYTMTSGNSGVWTIDNGNILETTGNIGIRPLINIKGNIKITSGNGTISNNWNSNSGPYILNQEDTINKSGNIKDIVTPGEYVLFAGKKYRVVNVFDFEMKLILDDYYKVNNQIYKTNFGSDSNFKNFIDVPDRKKNLLDFLVKPTDQENLLKINTNYWWWQNNLKVGEIYTNSVNRFGTTNMVESPVGLISVGELLASQSSSILTKGYTNVISNKNASIYWSLTSFDTNGQREYSISDLGGTYDNSISGEYAIRPVIVIKNANCNIISGMGTFSNPYLI